MQTSAWFGALEAGLSALLTIEVLIVLCPVVGVTLCSLTSGQGHASELLTVFENSLLHAFLLALQAKGVRLLHRVRFVPSLNSLVKCSYVSGTKMQLPRFGIAAALQSTSSCSTSCRLGYLMFRFRAIPLDCRLKTSVTLCVQCSSTTYGGVILTSWSCHYAV
jgi:hypothetical protein